MLDQTITCKDCNKDFVFTEREQEFFASKIDDKTGLPWNPPIRCKPCRDARKRSKPRHDQPRY